MERNNEVLETISLLSEIRDKNQWISLGRLRALLTRAMVNVYRLVENLNYISDGQYKALDKIFGELERSITETLEVRPQDSQGPLAVSLSEANIHMSRELGGKAAALGEITGIPGLKVPAGTVFTTYAYSRFLEHNGLFKHINKELLTLDPDDPLSLLGLSERLQALIMEAELPADLEQLLEDTYRQLQTPGAKPMPVVLRSSAVGEDSPGISFAGLYQSVLNPSPDALGDVYKQVVASKFSSRVLTYFMKRGIYHDICPMAVLFMELAPCKAAGVMFTQNPQGQTDTINISAVWGLGKLAVEGGVIPDQFKVARTEGMPIVEMVHGHKSHMLELAPEGGIVQKTVAEEMRDAPCLNEKQLESLALLGRQLEQYFGAPQDVEWILDLQDQIQIVQCRPLHLEQTILNWSDFYPWQDMAEAGEPLFKNLQVGNTGAACGKAIATKQSGQNAVFPSGSVFLVANTSPDLVNLLPKAAGIVAERGQHQRASGHYCAGIRCAPGHRLPHGPGGTAHLAKRGNPGRLHRSHIPRPGRAPVAGRQTDHGAGEKGASLAAANPAGQGPAICHPAEPHQSP